MSCTGLSKLKYKCRKCTSRFSSQRLLNAHNTEACGRSEIPGYSSMKGEQSAINHRFDLIDPDALLALAQVLYEGSQKYSDTNWRYINTQGHVAHGVRHLFLYLKRDNSEHHLAHAFCRIMFALATHLRPRYRGGRQRP